MTEEQILSMLLDLKKNVNPRTLRFKDEIVIQSNTICASVNCWENPKLHCSISILSPDTTMGFFGNHTSFCVQDQSTFLNVLIPRETFEESIFQMSLQHNLTGYTTALINEMLSISDLWYHIKTAS